MKNPFFPSELSPERLRSSILVSIFLLILAFSTYRIQELAVYVSNLVLNDNFSEVLDSRLYRSGELPLDELRSRIRQHRIRTVIDLRMADDHERRISQEAQLVKSLGAKYIHLRTNSSRYQTKKEAHAAISGILSAQTPVLIHCTDGTHRTGFFTALWMLLREGAQPKEAAEQLSLRYGFFSPERDLKRWKMGRLLLDDSFFAFLKASQSQPISWQEWVEMHL